MSHKQKLYQALVGHVNNFFFLFELENDYGKPENKLITDMRMHTSFVPPLQPELQLMHLQ